MAEITTSVQIILPQHCNGYERPRLFGGQIMAWIDITGAVAARRYAKCAVTTVCVDNLNFIAPAYLNDTMVQEARVTWTGRTSLEVRVDSFVEQLNGERSMVNQAYAVFVALDDNDSPAPIPPLHPGNRGRKAGIRRRFGTPENPAAKGLRINRFPCKLLFVGERGDGSRAARSRALRQGPEAPAPTPREITR